MALGTAQRGEARDAGSVQGALRDLHNPACPAKRRARSEGNGEYPMRRNLSLLLLVAAALWLAAMPFAQAHDARPAYLEINQIAAGRYSVLWRTPVLSGARLPVALRLPQSWRTVSEPAQQELNDSIIERRVVEPGAAGLAG